MRKKEKKANGNGKQKYIKMGKQRIEQSRVNEMLRKWIKQKDEAEEIIKEGTVRGKNTE